MPPHVLDVAIVGGGVAGVYAGWRLRTGSGSAGPPSVTVYEASSRIGGRLLSLTPPGMPQTRAELGGMRFESIHTIVDGLVRRELKLPTIKLPVAEPQNIAYLRGVHLRLKELATTAAVPYRLGAAERDTDPGLLLVEYALNQILPGATGMKYEQLVEAVRTARFDGRPLYEQGFWNVLRRVLTNEGYDFAMDAGGYDSLTSNWNAADALPFLLADFAPTVEYFRLVDGYETVPREIATRFEAEGGSVVTDTALRSFDRCTLPDGSEGFELRFRDRAEPVTARSLILAMPRRSIELLESSGPLLDPSNWEVYDLIESVQPIPLFKLFVCYDHPWWEATGVKAGRSVTDLPLRQCYYWAVEGEQPGADPSNRNAALLASYDDERYTTFWEGLMGSHHPRYQPRANPQTARHAGSESWSDYGAPAPMVEEAHRQLMELHGVTYAPQPYTAAYRDWQEDPYGGGVHFWKIGSKSWEVLPRILRPKPDLQVYICGEAYSHQQGWVEGALQTTEQMLQTYFELEPPGWLASEPTQPDEAVVARAEST